MSKKARIERPEDSVYRRITRSYVVALALIAVAVTATFATQKLATMVDEVGVRQVQLAERQSALSQRVALQAHQWLEAPDAEQRQGARESLERTASDLLESHVALLASAQTLTGTHDGLLSRLFSLSDRLLESEARVRVEDVVALTQLVEGELFDHLNSVATETQRKVAQRRMWIEGVAIALYVLTLLGLGAVAKYCFAPVAREATDRTRQCTHARSELSRLTKEISDRSRQIDQIRDEYRRRIAHDELTGLASRRCLMEFGERAIVEVEQEDREIAVMQIDLDRLGAINETLGHAAGDTVLQEAADILSGECRATDFPARSGGDKLALVLTDVTSITDVEVLAERLVKRLEAPVMVDEQVVHMSACVGVALRGDVAGDFSQLLRGAEEALADAKTRGPGQWARYGAFRDALPAARDKRFERLREALKHDTVKAWYVPVMRRGRAQSMDLQLCLVDRGGAHDQDRQDDLAETMFERALVMGSRAGAYWREEGVAVDHVTVGVDVAQLQRDGYAERLRALFAEFDVSPSHIALELSDGELADLDLADEHALCRNLAALQEEGISLTLSGVASVPSLFVRLEHLKPVRVVLADSFTSQEALAGSPGKAIQVLVRAASQRGFELIARDVHDAEHGAALAALGCELQQGPLHGGPMERALATRWLRDLPADGLAA
ncbi:MAG: diguanylate cyclase [Pseudomonadota bacterium]